LSVLFVFFVAFVVKKNFVIDHHEEHEEHEENA